MFIQAVRNKHVLLLEGGVGLGWCLYIWLVFYAILRDISLIRRRSVLWEEETNADGQFTGRPSRHSGIRARASSHYIDRFSSD